jgi:hypothetical protein
MMIDQKHFAYLVNQHGRVAHARNDFEKWKIAYTGSLEAMYVNISPALPTRCNSILDIGSGLGGIQLYLWEHYQKEAQVTLLDGDENGPEVKWSYEPHNSMAVAFDFLHKNGLTRVGSIGPTALDKWDGEPFDLVVSFAAWGFHFPPGNLIPDLKKCTHKSTVIITEVRRTKPDWLRELVLAFGSPKVLERAKKYVRVAFNA